MPRFFLNSETNELIRVNEPKNIVDLEQSVDKLLDELTLAREEGALTAEKALETVQSFTNNVSSFVRAQSRVNDCLERGMVEIKMKETETK